MKCATSGFQKTGDIAISLAAQGLSYARAGNWVGCVKSTVGKWLEEAPWPRRSCRRTERWNWTACGREPAGGVPN